MKILIFGNLGSGKTYLAKKLLEVFPNFEYLSIDDFRRKYGDGSMEKEKIAKQEFFNSILPDKFQLIEATGLGDTGEIIASKLKDTFEMKFIVILKIPLETCLERLKYRIWDIPYPAPTHKAFELTESTDKLIFENAIQSIWSNSKNCDFLEIDSISNEEIEKIIKTFNLKIQ